MFCTKAGRRREWLVSLGALLLSASENISSKCSIGIDKFMGCVHSTVELAAGSLLRVGSDVVIKSI